MGENGGFNNIYRVAQSQWLNIKTLQRLHYYWPTLAFNNPRSAFYNINAYIKFDENPLTLTKLSSGNENTEGRTDLRMTNVKPLCPATIM